MTDCLMLSVVVQLRWLLLANASQNAESTPSQTPATWPAINLAAMVARKTCSRFTYTGRIEGWVDEYAGYLASYMSSGSLGIGTPSCPWYVRARRGQRINLTLFQPTYKRLETSNFCRYWCRHLAKTTKSQTFHALSPNGNRVLVNGPGHT